MLQRSRFNPLAGERSRYRPPNAVERPCLGRLNILGQGLSFREFIRVTMMCFEEEAENCRKKALSYLGKPEAALLLRIAREFERLADERSSIIRDQRR